MALRRTSYLEKQNYPILTSRTYDSKMVPTFDHRLLCFMWPPLDPPPYYFMYIFGSYRSFVLVARFVLFRSFCFGHFGGFARFVSFCCIISSSWLPRKIRVILTRTFFARYFLNWKIRTLYVTLWLTPEENATRCEVIKIHIFINF